MRKFWRKMLSVACIVLGGVMASAFVEPGYSWECAERKIEQPPALEAQAGKTGTEPRKNGDSAETPEYVQPGIGYWRLLKSIFSATGQNNG